MIAKVAIMGATRGFDRPYDYEVPVDLQSQICVGQIVAVPFSTRKSPARGYVTDLADGQSERDLKRVDAILTTSPVVTPEQLRLGLEMRKRYFCSFTAALDCMLPPRISLIGHKKTRFVRLVDMDATADMLENNEFRSQGHIRVAELLLAQVDVSWHELKAAADVSDAVLRTLQKRQIIETFMVETDRPKEDLAEPESDSSPKLRNAQQQALDTLLQATRECQDGRLHEFLLHGVTGSGKTEVYLQLAASVLAEGKGVIILVPEIALTPQMEHRIRARFGPNLAIMHSRLTLTERFETWQRIGRGDVSIVVGARSAIFAPLQKIGLIVLDEEHESSYKSGLKPRYHAGEIARLRCLIHKAVLLLGSATPSLEAYERTKAKRSVLLTLPERIGQAGRPRMHLVDMKGVPKTSTNTIISEPLERAIRHALSKNEQAMILINRRGHERVTVCQSCGHVLKCGACEVALIQHLNQRSKTGHKRLFCHHCDRIYTMPSHCPACHEEALIQVGYGTQRVEETLLKIFPDVGIARMDQDTTFGRRGHQDILHRFATKDAMILLGTQMIAKGHDFSDATVVGILAADLLLNGDDFRSAERGFSLLMQAAGRAGRGDRLGDVYIQAYNTDDPLLKLALTQDYETFMQRESLYRKRLAYPPFGHIGMVMFSGLNEKKTKDQAEKFYEVLLEAKVRFTQFRAIQVFQPAPAPLSKLRNRYRYRLLAKGKTAQTLTELLALVNDSLPRRSVTRALDLDPQTML